MIQVTKETTKDGKVWYDVQLVDNLPFISRLTEEQLTELHLKICEHLFDNLLEQNKDLLQRLKNNEPAPKTVNAEDVLEWLGNNPATFGTRWCKTEIIIEQFKKDFGL